MTPYSIKPPTRNHNRVAGHSHDCALCGARRPARVGSKKAARRAAKAACKGDK